MLQIFHWLGRCETTFCFARLFDMQNHQHLRRFDIPPKQLELLSFQPPKLIICSITSLPTPATSKALATSRSVSLTSTTAHAFVTHFTDTFREGGSLVGTIDAGGYRVLKVKLVSVIATKWVSVSNWEELTSEPPSGAPVTLFSPDSMALSDWAVGPSEYSPPRGMMDCFWICDVFSWIFVVEYFPKSLCSVLLSGNTLSASDSICDHTSLLHAPLRKLVPLSNTFSTCGGLCPDYERDSFCLHVMEETVSNRYVVISVLRQPSSRFSQRSAKTAAWCSLPCSNLSISWIPWGTCLCTRHWNQLLYISRTQTPVVSQRLGTWSAFRWISLFTSAEHLATASANFSMGLVLPGIMMSCKSRLDV